MIRVTHFLAGLVVLFGLLAPGVASAQNADALMRLLRSGRLPAERMGNVIDAVSKRGSTEDLAYLLTQCATPEGFPAEVRGLAMNALADAAQARGAIPAADAAVLVGLINDGDPVVQGAAIRLAAQWKDASFVPSLIALTESEALDRKTAQALFAALSAIGDADSLQAISQAMSKLSEAGRWKIASEAAGALATATDPASQTASLDWALAAPAEADVAPVVRAFLNRQSGADHLAQLLNERTFSQDQSRLLLRTVYAAGRSDEALLAVLTERAGLESENEPWTAERMAAEVEQVLSAGDPARGELVFRRADLNCFNCHALSGAGGAIGPDLSPVGVSSPPDYLINAIINPAQDVKEVYQVHRVATIDGLLIAGVKVSETDETMVLRDAEGKTHIIPQEDIDQVGEGGSLMPNGLKVLMTNQEFHDLIAFLSVLGKPGPYVVRSRQTVQRWKVAGAKSIGLTQAVALTEQGMKGAVDAPIATWQSIYAKVAGGLPLDEVNSAIDDETIFLKAEINVTVAGEVRFEWMGPAASLYLDQQSIEANQVLSLEPGIHTLTVRMRRQDVQGDAFGEWVEPEGSSIDFVVVGGS